MAQRRFSAIEFETKPGRYRSGDWQTLVLRNLLLLHSGCHLVGCPFGKGHYGDHWIGP